MTKNDAERRDHASNAFDNAHAAQISSQMNTDANPELPLHHESSEKIEMPAEVNTNSSARSKVRPKKVFSLASSILLVQQTLAKFEITIKLLENHFPGLKLYRTTKHLRDFLSAEKDFSDARADDLILEIEELFPGLNLDKDITLQLGKGFRLAKLHLPFALISPFLVGGVDMLLELLETGLELPAVVRLIYSLVALRSAIHPSLTMSASYEEVLDKLDLVVGNLKRVDGIIRNVVGDGELDEIWQPLKDAAKKPRAKNLLAENFLTKISPLVDVCDDLIRNLEVDRPGWNIILKMKAAENEAGIEGGVGEEDEEVTEDN